MFTEHDGGAGLLLVDAPAFARETREMVVLESGDLVVTLAATRAVGGEHQGPGATAEVPPGEGPAELSLEVFIEGSADFLRGQDRYQSALRELPPGSMPPEGVWHDLVMRCPELELPRVKLVCFSVSDKGSQRRVVDWHAPRGPCEVGLAVAGGSLEFVPEYETVTVDPPGAVYLRLRP